MPELTDTAHNVGEVTSLITGRTAPNTGSYYEQTYLGVHGQTGVPELQVNRYQGGPVPLGGEVPTASLELTRTPELGVPQGGGYYTNTQQTVASETPARATAPVEEAGFPWQLLFMAFILGALVWCIYYLIRLWQDHQAQLAVLRAGDPAALQTTTVAPTVVQSASGPVMARVEAPLNETQDSWRDELTQADTSLHKLLEAAGVQGESMTEKLKNVSAGQFASVDIAWEAHQAAKELLSAHDAHVDTAAIERAKSLYKQVFADHGVV